MKLLHTCSIYERTHNGKFNGKDMYVRRKITNCNYEIQMNVCSKTTSFRSIILLMVDLKIHNTKSHGFQPFFHLQRLFKYITLLHDL